MKDITRDMCFRGHRFTRLADHPKINGIHACPHCMALQLKDKGVETQVITSEEVETLEASVKVGETLLTKYNGGNWRPFRSVGKLKASYVIDYLVVELERLRSRGNNLNPLESLIGAMVAINTAGEPKQVLNSLVSTCEKTIDASIELSKDLTRESNGKLTWLKTNLVEIIRITNELKKDLK
jgi:hypothetical protein